MEKLHLVPHSLITGLVGSVAVLGCAGAGGEPLAGWAAGWVAAGDRGLPLPAGTPCT